jgi:hypothetical protein
MVVLSMLLQTCSPRRVNTNYQSVLEPVTRLESRRGQNVEPCRIGLLDSDECIKIRAHGSEAKEMRPVNTQVPFIPDVLW